MRWKGQLTSFNGSNSQQTRRRDQVTRGVSRRGWDRIARGLGMEILHTTVNCQFQGRSDRIVEAL